MPLQDHLVEVARLLGVETPKAEVIDDEDIGCEQPPSHLLRAVIGSRLVQELEEAIGAQEEHVAPRTAGRMTDCGSQEGLSHSDRPQEEHVLLAFDEPEAEQVLHPVAIEGDRRVPVEGFEGLLLLEAGATQPLGEVLLISPVDLVLQDQLEEVELTELRLLRIRDPIGQRQQQAGQAQPLQHRLQGLGDLHGLRSPLGGGSFLQDAGSVGTAR